MMDDDIYAQADSIVNAHAVKGLATPYQAGFYYLDANLKFFVTGQPGISYLPFIRSSEMGGTARQPTRQEPRNQRR